MEFSYLLLRYIKRLAMSMDLIDNIVKKFYNFTITIVTFDRREVCYEKTEYARIGPGNGHGGGRL